jgi:integrase
MSMTRQDINLDEGSIFIPDTKNGKPHSLPITALVLEILRRRCVGLEATDQLFKGISKEHVHSMAIRRGAPRFMLHDLRKLVATTGEKLQISSAVLRRILNHTPPRSDVLHSHYVELGNADVKPALEAIQNELCRLMRE